MKTAIVTISDLRHRRSLLAEDYSDSATSIGGVRRQECDAVDIPTTLDGSFYVYAGAYPLFYLDGAMTVLCAECAEESVDSRFEPDRPVDFDVNWLDSALYCGVCGETIEVAYPDDADNGDSDKEANNEEG
ncbi:MAG: hypothetical protein DRJ03_02080 [Chloroflexi bacterium]|nr:MAG: hypothetical protein DRJ03_02080 [Chloroflexota bacterium]